MARSNRKDKVRSIVGSLPFLGAVHDERTVASVRKALKEAALEGSVCPCCDGRAQLYIRPLNSCMALCLTVLFKSQKTENDETFHHVRQLSLIYPHFSSEGGEFAKMVLWGLIEEMPKDPTVGGGSHSGFWRITQKGRDFVTRKISLPAYALLYNNVLQGFGGDDVMIDDLSDKKFNYHKLMSAGTDLIKQS